MFGRHLGIKLIARVSRDKNSPNLWKSREERRRSRTKFFHRGRFADTRSHEEEKRTSCQSGLRVSKNSTIPSLTTTSDSRFMKLAEPLKSERRVPCARRSLGARCLRFNLQICASACARAKTASNPWTRNNKTRRWRREMGNTSRALRAHLTRTYTTQRTTARFVERRFDERFNLLRQRSRR